MKINVLFGSCKMVSLCILWSFAVASVYGDPYDQRPPCHEWNDDSPRGWIPLYDPDTQGCCINPETGADEVTDIPENSDPCENIEDLLPEMPGFNPRGTVVCHNGEKVPCLIEGNIPQGWDPAVVNCIMEHERAHAESDDAECNKCERHLADVDDPEVKISEECKAYERQLDCLNDLGDLFDIPGALASWASAINNMRETYGCEESKYL